MDVPENLSVTLDATQARERFFQDLNGTTLGEVILFSMQFPFITSLTLSLELLVLNKFHMSNFKIAPKSVWIAFIVYLLEFMMIVPPVALLCTLLSDFAHVVLIFVIGLITVIVISSVSSADDQVLYWKLTNLKQILQSESLNSKKQLSITYFRSFVLLATAVSILGVDFHIFPRRFAKTETYGVSLMDMGVGLFVVSNALVEKRSSSVAELKKTLLSSLILLILGIFRYVLVQRFDYHMHVTEYGIHWNFFFTLAFVKSLSSLILFIFRGQSFVSGLVLMLIHQYLLSYSLESHVLNNGEREDWFNANREGIISLSGYLSIHLIGIAIGNLVNPPNKYLLNKHKLKMIVIFSGMFVFLLCVLYYFDSVGLKVSRRLANLPYVLWVTAISLELLVLFLFVEFISICFLPIEPKLRNNIYYLLTPVLLESINFNGLLFFLISNLFTGLINIYIDVFISGPVMSSLILLTYMFVDCAVVFILYMCNIRLKL